jgi:hypothetical protein
MVSLNYHYQTFAVTITVLSLNESTVNICHCCECRCVVKPVVGVEFFWLTEFERTNLSGSNFSPSSEQTFVCMSKNRYQSPPIWLSPCCLCPVPVPLLRWRVVRPPVIDGLFQHSLLITGRPRSHCTVTLRLRSGRSVRQNYTVETARNRSRPLHPLFSPH